jgi:ArsR family transcriptional regulator
LIGLQQTASIDQTVDALRFLSDGNRLRILAALAQSETCVCDLIDDLELPQTLVSYHLGKLRKAGLVRVRRKAQWSYYSLDQEAWGQLVAPLADLFGAQPFPPSAAYGASQRCDTVPADPRKGACSSDAEGCCQSEPAPMDFRVEAPGLSTAELDVLTEQVLARLLTRAGNPTRS